MLSTMDKVYEMRSHYTPRRQRKMKLRPGKATDPNWIENKLGLKRCKRNPKKFTNLSGSKGSALCRIKSLIRRAQRQNVSSTESGNS